MLHEDLKLYYWLKDWQMFFNVRKYKTVNVGFNNTNTVYALAQENIEIINSERYLGIIVQNTLKLSEYIAKIVQSANYVLGTINQNLT